jgi:predicted histone-like DNA-binding protein
MHYTIKKETKPNLKNYGRYKAVAVHYNTVTTEQLCREIQDSCSLKKSDVKAVLAELSEQLRRHLHDGDRIRLDGIGMLKMEIESDKVDRPEDFNIRQHLRNFRIHFLPESSKGRQDLYEGIRLEPAL